LNSHSNPIHVGTMSTHLIDKYNTAGPRYTSYPTVPHWHTEGFTEAVWKQHMRQAFVQHNTTHGLSLYVHLPYCESLCTFCGCNKRITKNHQVEQPYIEAVLHEWNMYLSLFDEKPRIAEIHLGGGTPSFFAPEMLEHLVAGLLAPATQTPSVSFGVEGHPNNTTAQHLKTLYDLGFRRVSFGIQDYDPGVQQAIHRPQTYQQVALVTDLSRSIGYTSVAHDLVYGLPFQSLDSVIKSVQKTILLRPDRIANYAYAHVPWLKGTGQRGFQDQDLPSPKIKKMLADVSHQLFKQSGYVEVGFDHYALPTDPLALAQKNGALHRNFMGYTTAQSPLVLGLGASAISDTQTAFSQNHKSVEQYTQALQQGKLPLEKGHQLTPQDRHVREVISDIMCRQETRWDNRWWSDEDTSSLYGYLHELASDRLIMLGQQSLRVLPKGRSFLRNICMAFDQRLRHQKSQQPVFSQTI
jgi:oxygen-independent coproporphyrinogen III oxidase